MDGKGGGHPLGVVQARPFRTRPKAWQQLWLDRHREAMLERLQGHVMTIADRLVGEGDMNPSLDEAYQFIVSQHTVPVEKVRALLDFLRKKPPEAFDHFQAALCALGCGEVSASANDVIELEAELGSLSAFERISLGFSASVERARNRLKTLYLKAAEKIHVLEGLSRNKDRGSRELDDVFVNIGLVSSDEVEKLCSKGTGNDGGVEELLANALVARQVSLRDLWQAEHGGKRPDSILALGTAGSGKTLAFTMKATYEWCGGEFWEEMALLRTIRCRDKSVWRAGTVSELFRLRELGLSAAEEREVEDLITDHSEQVALVCDGLDEGSVDKDSFLWRVLCRECLPGLRLIVTSRPCAAATDLSEDVAIDRHLQLFGFNEQNVQAYVVKYLGEEEGKKMLSRLAENPSVSSLMHTPFFALLICEQYKEAGQLPQRRTDIFSSVTLRIVQRFAKRQGLRATFKSVEKAPGKLFEKVLEVSKVAFDRLKNKDLSYFELEDGDLSAEALGLGFLEHLQATSLSDDDQYGFRHLTEQEYLAALYVCNSLLKKAEDVARLAEELGCGEEAGHLNTFWVFVAGLLGDSLREELFCAIAGTDIATVHSCMQAGERAAETGRAMGLSGGTDGEQPGTGDEGSSYFLPATAPSEHYRFLLLLHCYAEGNTIGAKKPSACVSYVLNRQGVACAGGAYILSHADCRVISKAMGCHSDIVAVEKVNVGLCRIGDDGLQQLLPGLLSCTRLKALDLSDNCLSATHMGKVGDLLIRNNSSLEILDLSWNPVGDDGLRHAKDGLRQLQQLKCLSWNDPGLTPRGVRLLADVISHQPALVVCDLSEIAMGGAAFVDIGSALQKCKHMEKLYLYKTGLTSNSMGLLASVLAGLPQLRDLDIRYNSVGVEGFKLLCPGLQQCPQLRLLYLDECGLTGDSQVLALLTMVLLCVPQLRRFSLSENEIGDAGLCQLCIGLEECRQLTTLVLRNTGLASSQSITAVSRLLRRLNKLRRLAIYENPYSGSSDDLQLCDAVKGHPLLDTLLVPAGLSQDAVRSLQCFADDPSSVLRFFRVTWRLD